MRPEYFAAVQTVRWGWSFWALVAMPAAPIWIYALRQHRAPGRGWVVFLGGCLAFYLLGVIHSNRIERAKGMNMQTEVEQSDWSADTWNVYAPIFVAPYAIGYCGANAALAFAVATARNRRRGQLQSAA